MPRKEYPFTIGEIKPRSGDFIKDELHQRCSDGNDSSKTCRMGEVDVSALDHVSLSIPSRAFTALVDPSGSGSRPWTGRPS